MEIQKQFADFVNQVNKSKLPVQKALDKTQLLFDSLMQIILVREIVVHEEVAVYGTGTGKSEG